MESGHNVKTSLSTIFGRILGLGNESDTGVLEAFEEGGIAQVQEVSLFCGDSLYSRDEVADSFYVVLAGCVEICRDSYEDNANFLNTSGRSLASEKSKIGDVVSYLHVGGIFGYVDFSLGRRRSFDAICSKDGTIVAEISSEAMDKLEHQDPNLHRILEKILLQASLMELGNFDVA
eukprot:CAMPEP_0197259498 /NCGR_PEP_ID=MMETSP1429-20130617/83547_1 /TAXON_ID=49237 /ORGANISM="Chaetoceros  sp., Strain UNC1202" /LENGTH=175 /DNA_ID=CAMNT_0042723705 /DNA_START=423 /DNA_END=950 /DNA_ORIENTATION=+